VASYRRRLAYLRMTRGADIVLTGSRQSPHMLLANYAAHKRRVRVSGGWNAAPDFHCKFNILGMDRPSRPGGGPTALLLHRILLLGCARIG
jgi:hypothetical protein